MQWRRSAGARLRRWRFRATSRSVLTTRLSLMRLCQNSAESTRGSTTLGAERRFARTRFVACLLPPPSFWMWTPFPQHHRVGISKPVLELTDEDLDLMISLNTKSVLYGMQTAVPYFKTQKKGQVINVSSLLGRLPMASLRAAYRCAAGGLPKSLPPSLCDTRRPPPPDVLSADADQPGRPHQPARTSPPEPARPHYPPRAAL